MVRMAKRFTGRYLSYSWKLWGRLMEAPEIEALFEFHQSEL